MLPHPTWSHFALLLIIVITPGRTLAQGSDTISLSFNQVEDLFLRQNYRLLAQRFNITAAEGAIRQSKLWNNPLFFVESNLYNPLNQKYFHYGATDFKWYDGKPVDGQFMVQLNQLLLMGGKRSKMVHLAETNRDIQAAVFDDLMRALHFNLFESYVMLYYDLQVIRLLHEEEQQLSRLISIEEVALEKGAVSRYEVMRLQFELQEIRRLIKEQRDEQADDENNLRTLLSSEPSAFYKPSVLEGPRNLPASEVNSLIDSALTNRPEMRIVQYNLEYNRSNISLQKAYSIPDLNLGATYDKSGNAYYNYTGLNLAFNLPLFNRNQGNIKIAEQQLQQSQIQLKMTTFGIKEDVLNAYQKWQNSLSQFQQIQPDYVKNLEELSITATENYNRRTISLLDYLDKIRTARNAHLNLFNAQQTLILSQEYINFVTHSRIFR